MPVPELLKYFQHSAELSGSEYFLYFLLMEEEALEAGQLELELGPGPGPVQRGKYYRTHPEQ